MLRAIKDFFDFRSWQHKKLVIIVIASVLLETFLYFFIRYLGRGDVGVIRDVRLLFGLIYASSAMLKMPFLIIIIWYQRLQKKYLFYSIFSILGLIFFYFFIMNFYETGGQQASLADYSFGFAVLSFTMAAAIGFDATIEGYPKFVVLMNSFLLIVYRTPVLIFLWIMTSQIFSTELESSYSAILRFNYVTLGVFIVWSLFQARFVSRIDYI